MSFKLNKQEIARRDKFIEDINVAWGALEDAINVHNEALAALKEPVEAACTAYNEIVAEARGFAEDIAAQAESDIDEKSDRWKDGDKGQAAVAFKDEWQGVTLDDIEIEYPDEIKFDDPDYGTTLDGLPVEADA